jgi:hypothetical protein
MMRQGLGGERAAASGAALVPQEQMIFLFFAFRMGMIQRQREEMVSQHKTWDAVDEGFYGRLQSKVSP